MNELKLLKEQADLLGINYAKNTSATKLKEKIKKVTGEQNTKVHNQEEDPITKLRREATKLVRVRITPNDPMLQQLPGEYHSVGNSVLPTITRYIPYNLDESDDPDAAWHVEKMLLDAIREKKYQVHKSIRTPKGIRVFSKSVPAFTIEEIPPLTPKQLKELAVKQAAAEGKTLD